MHAVQGSLRRVSEFVVVNNASHGKQIVNDQAITCHSDHDHITGAASKFGDYIARLSRKLARKKEAAGGVQTTTESKATAGTRPSADKPMTPALTGTRWVSG
ncbi:uncharacterized protein N7487_004317 [Penicillium crustosum]|uniref:uncharacterized protein n=1 Tax=Penicillium crustosum TaxID=36656 RepID=UPI0023957325|nr:uncharacterized protein N7487_004317 [Penicillium crustosum]KAJ5409958.1 hypothetical protein N7487_004317 [Penicillium crustosum]